MLKKILLIAFVVIAYFLYIRLVLNPQALNNFSLIDDGQLIKYGIYLKGCVIGHDCIGFKTQIIDSLPDVGLSRAGAWLVHGLLYQGSWINATFQHILRAYGFGLVMVLLLVLAGLSAGSGLIAILVGVTLFVVNYSFAENIIRLGPIEPYLVIFLGTFSLLFLNFNKFPKRWKLPATLGLFFFLIYLLLIKEASIAILPAILLTQILFSKTQKTKTLIIMLAVSSGIYFLAKYLLGGFGLNSDYAENYKFEPIFIIKNSWNYITLLSSSLGPFFDFSFIIIPFLLIFKKFRQKIFDKHLVYWFWVFISFTAILFPWKYVFDRYLLPSIFSFSIFATIVVGRIVGETEKLVKPNKTTKILFNTFIFLVISNILFIKIPENLAKSVNYKNWFKIFTQFEADQVNAIAKTPGTVYINAKNNIDTWEVNYEIPMHLDYFYNVKPEVKRMEENIPVKGYLFSRSLLDLNINQDVLSKNTYPIVDSKEYNVSQIDVALFDQLFKARPLQTLLRPPLDKKGTIFYWEIRKIK